MRKSLLPVAFGLFLLGGAAGAESVNVDGTTVVIGALPGYCNDTSREVRAALEQLTPKAKVLAVSALCGDLPGIVAGIKPLKSYIVWAVEAENGVAFRLPPQYTRSDYARGLAKATKTMNKADIESEAAKNLRESGIRPQLKSLGLIDSDGQAVYIAMLMSGADDHGNIRAEASVSGMAAIHHLSLSIHVYDEFNGSSTYSNLLASAKSLMRAALQDNPAP
jgi:hypothetical protein